MVCLTVVLPHGIASGNAPTQRTTPKWLELCEFNSHLGGHEKPTQQTLKRTTTRSVVAKMSVVWGIIVWLVILAMFIS